MAVKTFPFILNPRTPKSIDDLFENIPSDISNALTSKGKIRLSTKLFDYRYEKRQTRHQSEINDYLIAGSQRIYFGKHEEGFWIRLESISEVSDDKEKKWESWLNNLPHLSSNQAHNEGYYNYMTGGKKENREGFPKETFFFYVGQNKIFGTDMKMIRKGLVHSMVRYIALAIDDFNKSTHSD